MNVIVTGTLGYDHIMDFSGRIADRVMPEKIHKISLSFLVDKLSKQMGGTAGNIAYTLKLLGVEPFIVSVAGNDFFPYKTVLKKHKLSTKYIKECKDVVTGSYFVVTDSDDNQLGAFYSGATKYAKDLSLGDALQDLALKGVALKGSPKPFVIVAPTDPAAMKKYVKECQTLSLPYLYDPAFQIVTFSAEELKDGINGANILIGNDYEMSLIEEKLDIPHEELRVMVPIVITTLGSKGSIIETRRESIHVKPAKPKNISDPTGAGDAFRAGFIAGYLKVLSRLSLENKRLSLNADELTECGQMGSVAAVYTVETYGTQTHTFTPNEFTKRYKENFGATVKL